MERKWETPRVLVQEFEPNEYVAVCWGVACSVNEANGIEEDRQNTMGGEIVHRSEYCGNSLNQHIEANASGVATGMIETGTDGLGNLTCTLYTDNTYRWRDNFSDVSIGDTIYWTTSAGNKTWHHVGTVVGVDDKHPNRS